MMNPILLMDSYESFLQGNIPIEGQEFFPVLEFDPDEIGPNKVAYTAMIEKLNTLYDLELGKPIPRLVQTIQKILTVSKPLFLLIYAVGYFSDEVRRTRIFSVLYGESFDFRYLGCVLVFVLLWKTVGLANDYLKLKGLELAETKWNTEYAKELEAFRKRRKHDTDPCEFEGAQEDAFVNALNIYKGDRESQTFKELKERYDKALKTWTKYKNLISEKTFSTPIEKFAGKSYLTMFEGKNSKII